MSHPTLEVRGRSREDPMPKGRRPRGVTPCPRSEAAAESTRLRRRRNGREELPRVRGQGALPRGVTPHPRSGLVGGRSYPTPPRPHTWGQGWWPGGPTVAARAQEGLEELSHVEGQEGRQWGDTLILFIIKTIKYFKQKVKNLQSGKKKEWKIPGESIVVTILLLFCSVHS